MAKIANLDEKYLLLRKFVYDIELRADYFIEQIKNYGHNELKKRKLLFKEISIFSHALLLATERNSEEFPEYNSNFKKINTFCENISKLANNALSSGRLTHEVLEQINGQLFFIKQELKKIDT